MKLRRTALFLTLCLCTGVFFGCKSEGDDSAPKGKSTMHITVESKTISEEALRAQNYVVPLYITLENNGGITYAEWGLNLDPRVTVTANSKKLPFNTYSSINDEKHFLWTAWASGSVDDTTGELLQIEVTLPSTAKAGETYTITYADVSAVDKPHVWKGDTDWVAENQVTWTDGGITVVE